MMNHTDLVTQCKDNKENQPKKIERLSNSDKDEQETDVIQMLSCLFY